MTHDISELIAGIRAWQAADMAYEEARKTLTGGAMTNQNTREAVAWLDLHASAVTGNQHNAPSLAVFVALADHVAALEAQNNTLRHVLKNIASNAPQSEPSRTINYGNAAAITYAFWYAGVIANNALLGEPTASEGDA